MDDINERATVALNRLVEHVDDGVREAASAIARALGDAQTRTGEIRALIAKRRVLTDALDRHWPAEQRKTAALIRERRDDAKTKWQKSPFCLGPTEEHPPRTKRQLCIDRNNLTLGRYYALRDLYDELK